MKKLLTILAVSFFCFTLFSCNTQQQTSAEKAEFNKKKETVASLMIKQPGPSVKWSADRFLLNERLVRFNNPNKMSYLYIFLFDGRLLETTIKCKLASTSKRLTATVQQYSVDRGQYTGTGLGPAPDEMGTYGHSSGGAKVGMTTLGSLIEMGGGLYFYIYSETPLLFQGVEKKISFTVDASPGELNEFKDRLNRLEKERKQAMGG